MHIPGILCFCSSFLSGTISAALILISGSSFQCFPFPLLGHSLGTACRMRAQASAPLINLPFLWRSSSALPAVLCENSCFLSLVQFSSCFHTIWFQTDLLCHDRKWNSPWHMFLRHLVINYSNRRQGSELALTLQNGCFVFTVSCLFFICLFLWK